MSTLVPVFLLSVALSVGDLSPQDDGADELSGVAAAVHAAQTVARDDGHPVEVKQLPEDMDPRWTAIVMDTALLCVSGGLGCAVPFLVQSRLGGQGDLGLALALLSGPLASCGSVVAISLASQFLTGRSPLPTWYGAAAGAALVPIALAGLGVSYWTYDVILTDTDRATLNTCNPTGAGMLWAAFTFITTVSLSYCSGPAIAVGAAVGAKLAPASDEPPNSVTDTEDTTAMAY